MKKTNAQGHFIILPSSFFIQKMARGGAAFGGIVKFFAAGAASARARDGGRRSGHGGRFLTQRREDA
jgi:hypothetical protein